MPGGMLAVLPRQFPTPCGTLLMKTIRTSAGTTCLPECYDTDQKSHFTSWLKKLSNGESANKCRTYWVTYMMVKCIWWYDGKVWMMVKCGSVDVSAPVPCVNLFPALILNIDWFQPFKHSVYSIGANLPRSALLELLPCWNYTWPQRTQTGWRPTGAMGWFNNERCLWYSSYGMV